MNLRGAVIGLVAVGIGAVGTLVILDRTGDEDTTTVPSTSAPKAGVVASGSDRLPSDTASDWVTYADHVVVATAVSEVESPPMDSEVDRGEGLIGRDVTLRVDDVVWSRDDASEPVPSTWVRNSPGWTFTGDTDNRTEFSFAEYPRVEVGHTYIIALVWECMIIEDNGPEEITEAKWLGLGEGSTVPYDDGTIGNGEYEGEIQTAEQARANVPADSPNDDLEDKLAGHDAAALTDALNTATPNADPKFTVTSGDNCN